MRRLNIYCGCNRLISKHEYPEQPDGFSEALGQCEECDKNGGKYNLSSAWTEPPAPVKKVLTVQDNHQSNITPVKKSKSEKRGNRYGG